MDDAQKKAILKAYGSRLRDLRRQKGLSQEELSEEMRYSVRQIQKVEAGKSNPSLLFISNWLEITCEKSFFSILAALIKLPKFKEKENE